MSKLLFPNNIIKEAAWLESNSNEAQILLEECYVASERVKCLCQQDKPNDKAPLLYIRFTDKYILARMPGTRHEHQSNCQFSHEYQQYDTHFEEVQMTYKETEDGKFIINPEFQLSRTIQGNVEDQRSEEENHIKKHNTINLTNFLHILWEKSANNRHFPDTSRDWSKTAWFLNKVIQNGQIGNMSMSEVVFIPVWRKNEEHKRKFWKWAEKLSSAGKSGKLGILIGSVKSLQNEQEDNNKIEITLEDLPITIILSDSCKKQFIKQRQQLKLLSQLSPQSAVKSVGVFIVSNGYRQNANGIKVKCLIASKAVIMITTNDYIPVNNKYELMMSDALTKAKRAYIKPLNSFEYKDQSPTFVLIDEKPATFVEVIISEKKDELKENKDITMQKYLDRGHKVIVWNLLLKEKIPTIHSIK